MCELVSIIILDVAFKSDTNTFYFHFDSFTYIFN